MPIRSFICCILFLLFGQVAFAQNSEHFFHKAASFFINGNNEEARRQVFAGLSKYPNDSKLKALERELREKPPQPQPPNNQQEKDQDKEKEKDKKNQPKQNEQEQQKNQQEKADSKGQQQREQERQELSDRLRQMGLTEEKAKMILDAMKNNEIQYLQQRKKEGEKKNDKSGQPDW